LFTNDGTRLGFSLANNSATTGQYTVVTRDEYNYVVDIEYYPIQAWSQISAFVDEVAKLPSNGIGSAEIVGLSGGQNYAVGLQYSGSTFAAIQPIVRATPLPQ